MIRFILLSLEIVVLIIVFQCDKSTAKLHPDAGLSIYELVEKYEYKLENHTIRTEDKYALLVHRIGPKISTNKTRPVILLNHGMLSSSADWINMGPERALGLLLVERGFDVWLANQRGNTYSRIHAKFDPDKDAEKFFNFGFHEIGIYDTSAIIDYILRKTDASKISYVAHSQGSTALLVLCAERPDYQNKIEKFIALAPVTTLFHVNNTLLRYASNYLLPLEILAKRIHLYEVFSRNSSTIRKLTDLCTNEPFGEEMCWTLVQYFAGFDPSELDPKILPVIMTNFPAGGSLKQFIHYGQLMLSNEFRKYDYGLLKNLVVYHQKVPPVYDLDSIRIPTIIYYGRNDIITTPKDVSYLIKRLPNLLKVQEVEDITFSHLDFLWSTDIYRLVNRYVIQDVLDTTNYI